MSVPEQTLRNHQVGNPSIHHYELRNAVTGFLADPATLVVTAKPPTGDPVVYTYPHAIFTKLGTGIYRAAVPHASGTGKWKVKLVATNPDITLVGEVEVIDAYTAT